MLNEIEDRCFDHDVQICNPHHGFVRVRSCICGLVLIDGSKRPYFDEVPHHQINKLLVYTISLLLTQMDFSHKAKSNKKKCILNFD